MATEGSTCYYISDRSIRGNVHKNKMGPYQASSVIPNMPQSAPAKQRSVYRQQYGFSQPSGGRRNATEMNYPLDEKTYTDRYLIVTQPSAPSCEGKTQHNSGSSKPDSLKRRPSLREAARSFRSSNVVKKLRRDGRSGYDHEEGDDAGASASESDNPSDQSRTQFPGNLPQNQPPRCGSAVSELTNGLQSSLSIGSYSRGRGSSSASSSSSRMVDSSDAASTRTSITSLSNFSKASQDFEEEGLEADDDNESDQGHKRSGSISALGPEQPQLFACPFAKHDPHRYSAANLDELNYRGCSQSYLTDLARVKQHLYRVHERPPHHCPQCYEVFKNQGQCIKHVASQSCHSRLCPFKEKMSSEQLIAIKKKNRGTDPYLGWYEIYKTLFPGSQLPMSPYAAFAANVDTLESFMDFVLRELPTRLQQRAQYRNPNIEILQVHLPDVLRDIRKDFHPGTQSQQQQSPTALAPDPGEEAVPTSTDRDDGHAHNFHHSVTMAPTEQDQMRMSHPPTIDIPPTHPYIYTQPLQVLATSIPAHPTYRNQQMQQAMAVQYTNQGFDYTLQHQNQIPGLESGPPTAIWQPDMRDHPHGYFIDQHQTQQLLPSYTLQVESEGGWIPSMVTTSMAQSLDDGSMQGMMGGFYQGAFTNQPN